MNVRGILFGTGVSYFITGAALVLCAALQYLGAADEKTACVAAMCAALLSTAVGGFVSAKKSGGKKLFNALAVSLMFILPVIAAAFYINGGMTFHIRLLMLTLFSTVAGILGAILA